MRRKLFILTMALMGTLFFVACDDDDDKPSNTTTFMATLNGASEVPANASTATGTATFTYDKTTKIMVMSLNYTEMTVTAAHIHKGQPGVSGNVILPITGALTSPISFTFPALTTEQESDLNAGAYYVNLHTAAYPNGEIRGQLMAH